MSTKANEALGRRSFLGMSAMAGGSGLLLLKTSDCFQLAG